MLTIQGLVGHIIMTAGLILGWLWLRTENIWQ
jgi:hypothetical protein